MLRAPICLLGGLACWALLPGTAVAGQIPPGAALVVEKDGVQVHQLPLPAGASTGGAAVNLLASAVVDVPADELLDLLVDYRWRTKYLPELVENRVLAQGD